MNTEEKDELGEILDSLIYTCGSRLQEIEGTTTGLLDKTYVKQNLTCNSYTEIPYYSAKYEDICYYCGTTEDLVVSSTDYPICSNCQRHHSAIAKRKRKFGPSNKK